MNESTVQRFVCPCGECERVLSIDLAQRTIGIDDPRDHVEIIIQWPLRSSAYSVFFSEDVLELSADLSTLSILLDQDMCDALAWLGLQED